MFCCIQASFYNLVMLFNAFRLRNHKYYSMHTFNLSSYVAIYLQRFQFCFFGLFFLFLISQHFSLWHIFWECTVALSLQEGFHLVFWLQFTFVLFRFFVSLVRLSFTRESAYSVWILTNYTDIFLYLFSLQSNVLAGIITC